MARPRISFTFPYRWLKEDRAYLHKNLERSAIKSGNSEVLNSALLNVMQTPLTPAFMVLLKCHAYQPKTYKFLPEDAEKAFGKILPGARCLNVEKRFVQIESRTSLPVMEMEVYY